MDVDILLWFQSIRNSFLDGFFNFFSFLGSDIFVLLLIATVYWCYNKKTGILMAFNLYIVGAINAVLSTYVSVGGPWLKDNRLQPLGSADSYGQQAFSFACIKTSKVGATLGTLAFSGIKRSAVRVALMAVILVVGVSQLYIGVEGPQDVFIAIGVSLLVIIITNFIALFAQLNQGSDFIIMIASVAIAIVAGVIVYFNVYDVTLIGTTQGITPHIVSSLSKLTALAVFAPCWIWEKRKINFKTTASLHIQLAKLIVGGGVVYILIEALKAPLDTALTAMLCSAGTGQLISGMVRYGVASMFITAIYPMIFTAVLKKHLIHLPVNTDVTAGETFLPTAAASLVDDKQIEKDTEQPKECTDIIKDNSPTAIATPAEATAQLRYTPEDAMPKGKIAIEEQQEVSDLDKHHINTIERAEKLIEKLCDEAPLDNTMEDELIEDEAPQNKATK